MSSSGSGSDYRQDKTNSQWQEDVKGISELAKDERTEDDRIDRIFNRIDADKEEIHRDIRQNYKDLIRQVYDLDNERKIRYDIIISVGLAMLGLLLGGFYHFTLQISNVNGRTDQIYQLLLLDKFEMDPLPKDSDEQHQSEPSILEK